MILRDVRVSLRALLAFGFFEDLERGIGEANIIGRWGLGRNLANCGAELVFKDLDVDTCLGADALEE